MHSLRHLIWANVLRRALVHIDPCPTSSHAQGFRTADTCRRFSSGVLLESFIDIVHNLVKCLSSLFAVSEGDFGVARWSYGLPLSWLWHYAHLKQWLPKFKSFDSAFRSGWNKLLRIVLLLAEGLRERRNSSNDARDHQNEGNE